MKTFERYLPHFCLTVLLLCVAGVASAQTVTLSAAKTVADGSLVPVLTWSSSPGATVCTASGSWSGTKANAGTQTLPAITANAAYTLTCSWAATVGAATVNWTAPTTNTDGSALTNLTGFKIYSGTAPAALTQVTDVPGATMTTGNVTGLSSATWYFAVSALNSNGAESAFSPVVSKVVNVGAPTATASVAITIRPVPAAPTVTTVTVASVPFVPVFRVGANNVRGELYGMVPVGRECTGPVLWHWRSQDYRRVAVRLDEVFWTKNLANLAAPCGPGA